VDDLEKIAKLSVDSGFRLHKALGPGLLESVYEHLLFESLKDEGFSVERQRMIPIVYKGRVIDAAFRADLIVEKRLLIELRSTERDSMVHTKQVFTYLRLMDLSLGFLMNFGAATFKEGVKRLANDYYRKN